MANKIVTLLNVRLSYPKLFKAEDYQGDGNFAYGATFIIEPGSDSDKAIRAAITEVAKETFGEKAAQKLKQFGGDKTKFPFRDGDITGKEETAGKWTLTSKRPLANGRPLLNNKQGKPVMEGDAGAPYAGCYVNAKVEIYAQTGKNDGIRCGLLGVMFWSDGAAFSGGAAISDSMFADLVCDVEEESLV